MSAPELYHRADGSEVRVDERSGGRVYCTVWVKGEHARRVHLTEAEFARSVARHNLQPGPFVQPARAAVA